MEIVRRHRRVILLVLSVVMLSAMTYGFLRRVGVDPLGDLAPERGDGP